MIPRPMKKYESFAAVSMIFKENAKLYKEMSKKTQIAQIVSFLNTLGKMKEEIVCFNISFQE